MLAAFSGIEVDEAKAERIVDATTFANVKKAIEADDSEDPMAETFEGSRKGFFFAGSNGRWRDVLSDAELELYEAANGRLLTADCARYLELGRRSS